MGVVVSGNSENVEETEETSSSHEPMDQSSTALMIEKSVNSFDTSNDTFGLWVGSKSSDLVRGFDLVIHQLKALFVKRFIHSLRNKALVIAQILVPIGVLLIDLNYIKFGPVKAEDSPLLTMTLDRYRDNYVAYQINANNSRLDEWAKLFAVSVDASANAKAFRLDTNDTVDVCPRTRGFCKFLLSI